MKNSQKKESNYIDYNTQRHKRIMWILIHCFPQEEIQDWIAFGSENLRVLGAVEEMLDKAKEDSKKEGEIDKEEEFA